MEPGNSSGQFRADEILLFPNSIKMCGFMKTASVGFPLFPSFAKPVLFAKNIALALQLVPWSIAEWNNVGINIVIR